MFEWLINVWVAYIIQNYCMHRVIKSASGEQLPSKANWKADGILPGDRSDASFL